MSVGGARSERARAVAFDLDGTLLRGTSVSTVLAERTGRGDRLRDLEAAYAAGDLGNDAVADLTAPWFEGLTTARIGELLRDAPWIDGIHETVAALHAAGVSPLLATVTWRFAAELVAERFGLEAVSGTVMGVDGGVLTGRVERHCDDVGKRDAVRRWAAGHGVAMDRVVAVGDSRSDLPLFAGVGLAIAVNASPAARATADLVLDTDDLRDVLAYLPGSTTGVA